jgi:MFS superfamily sulfate permease-like transporter
LYGYAAVIFNNPVFNDHMNALSKLVIFSSLIHQLGFFLFSSLDFAIGTVQDAGLIFLSSMANTIANHMLEDGHTEQEIVSATLVLGLVLMLMGRFRLADAVAYLPMPVVGGYLAFIGYFCCQAGVALCISQPIMTLGDWKYVFEPKNLMLAVPGLVTGVVLTLTSRLATNSGVLPLVMVSIPALFYMTLYFTGTTLDEVREDSWVGPVAPSVPVGDLFNLVDFRLVRSCMRTSPTLGFVLEKGLD